MKDIDDLKRKWQNIDLSDTGLDQPGAGNGDDRQSGSDRHRKKTGMEMPRSIKQRMISRLQRLYFAVVAGILFIPSLSKEFDMPLWFVICWILYFALACAINYIQIRSLKNADFATMTTVDSIGFIKKFTKRKMCFRFTLMPLGAGLIIALIALLNHEDDPYLLAGIAQGVILGLIIGLSINNRLNADLRLLKNYLGED